MIGSCHFYNPFLAFPIPLKLLGVGKTGCVRPSLGAICLGFYYKALENPHFSPMESIWSVNVPTKVAFFMWTAASGNIHTMDNLLKRNICIVEWCCMFNSVRTMGSL